MTPAPVAPWSEVTAWVEKSPVAAGIRSPHPAAKTVETMGLKPGSYLHALAQNSSGLIVDAGWLRLLGGSSGDGLPGLDEANAAASGMLVVAFDVLGGVFALDGGALGAGDGSVHHFSVDSLRWEGLGLTYPAFISAMLGGATIDFYESLRWSGWEKEVGLLGPDQGLFLYPFPFTQEGKNVASSTRQALPFSELIDLHNDLVRQLDATDAGPAIPSSAFD